MKRCVVRFLDLLFLTRPILLVPVWGFCAFGYWHGRNGELDSLYSFWKSTPLFVYFYIFIFSLSVGSVYILNQIADIKVDKKNGGLPLLASGITTKKVAWTGAITLFAISSLLPIVTGHTTLSLFAIFSVTLGFLYSFKPMSFSGKPVLDFISNAIGYGTIAFGAGWYLSRGTGEISILTFASKSLPYVLLMCAGSISSTLPDREGDLLEGKNTTAVVFGNRNSNLLATLILITSLIYSIFYFDPIALICTSIPLPIYIGFIFRPNTILMESTYKIGGALCIICACSILPLLLPAGMLVFFLTRLYFRLRHHVIYPSLVPVQ